MPTYLDPTSIETVDIQRHDPSAGRHAFTDVATLVQMDIQPSGGQMTTQGFVLQGNAGFFCYVETPISGIRRGDYITRSDSSQLLVGQVHSFGDDVEYYQASEVEGTVL